MPSYSNAAQNILDFCSILRLQGFTIGPQETQDALTALTTIDLSQYQQSKDALSLILCSSQAHEESFDVLFRAYFLPAPKKERPPESQAKASEGGDGDDKEEAPQQRKKQHSKPQESLVASSAEIGEVTDTEDEDNEGGSPATLKAFFSPFSRRYETPVEVSSEDMDAMRDAARQLVNKVRLGKSRRWQATTRGPKFNFRRTLRKSLSTGGEAIKPAWLGHPQRKPHFVLLLDSSRSMASYSNKLLQFAHALSQRSSRVDVFLFSTSLKRVTKHLRKTKASSSLRLTDLGEAFGGGTQIGACFTEFNRRYAQGAVTPDTLVLIASDGLDTGKPEILQRAMRDIHRRSSGVVWLNPLLDTEGYEPTAAGMQAALPYIDTFCTVKDSSSFERLSKEIRLRH